MSLSAYPKKESVCGILGLINPLHESGQRFERALTLLSHRGPECSEVQKRGKVVLGHRRLSIQDLTSAANQPMSDSSQNVWITFNGEIYNFKELRPELERLGSRFQSLSDTEVILQGYKCWGWPQVLERLQGDFAFAIYDEEAERVVLARDHLGKKPLFYSSCGSTFIFASEIKAITDYIGPRPLDRYASLNPILTTGLAPPGMTMFEGIREVEPGCYLEYSLKSSEIRHKRYFDIADIVSKSAYQELSSTPSAELITRYCGALENSVATHLISDAKLGVMFSSGVDSSLISAAAMKGGDPDIALFHFASELLDATGHASAFQQRFTANLKTLRFNEQEIIYELPKMVYNYETVNKQDGTVLGLVCKAAHKEGYKVLLTGDGSDELFGGYHAHKSFYTRTRVNNTRFLKLMFRFLNRAFPGIGRLGDTPRGTDYFMFPSDLNLLEGPLNLLLHSGTRLSGWTKCLEAYDFLANPAERETAAYLLDDINYRLQRFMIRSDRIGMMESVELRMPFLYMPLVKLAVNTPLKWRLGTSLFSRRPDALSPFSEKKIVKEMAKRFSVPKDIVYRRKIGTPFNGSQQIRRLTERFPFKNVAEFFEIPEYRIRDILLKSFDPDVGRLRWSMLATEVLIREFVHQENHELISDEFRAILRVK